MYELEIRILDYRDQLETIRSRTGVNARATVGVLAPSNEEIFDRGIITVRAYFNNWKERPILDLKSFNAGADTRALIAKPDTQMTFDVGDSTLFDVVDAKVKFSVCRLKTYAQSDAEKCIPTASFTNPTILPFKSKNTIYTPTFVEQGEYMVTVILTDKYGQTDERSRYVVIKDPTHQFMKSTFIYPSIERAVQGVSGRELGKTGKPVQARDINGVAEYVDHMPFVMHNSARLRRASVRWNPWGEGINFRNSLCDSIRSYSNAQEYTAELYGIDDTDYFANLNPYTAYLAPPLVTTPATNTAAGYPIVSGNGVNCGMAILRTVGASLRPARSDNDLFFSSSNWFQSVRFDTFAGLRVPKVVMSILPDEMLPGDATLANSKIQMVEENVIPSRDYPGRDDFLLTVRMRESDFKFNQKLTFQVPVYAVDEDGQFLKNNNGYFFARFDNLGPSEQDCLDCIMKDGKAYIEVSVNPRDYAIDPNDGPGGTTKTLDLTAITVSNDATYKKDLRVLNPDGTLRPSETCSAYYPDDDQDSQILTAANQKVLGCARLDKNGTAGGADGKVSSLVPELTSRPAAVTYPILESSERFFGKVVIGATAEKVKAFNLYLKEGIWKDVRNIVDWIPVLGSSLAFFDAIQACNKATEEAKRCDAVGLIWAGFLAGGDALTLGFGGTAVKFGTAGITKFFKLFKFSEGGFARGVMTKVGQGAGEFANTMRATMTEALESGTKNFQAMQAVLETKYKSIADVLSKCVLKCSKHSDELFGQLRNGFRETADATAQKVKKFLENQKDCAIGALGFAATYVSQEVVSEFQAYTLEYVQEYFLGILDDGLPVSDPADEIALDLTGRSTNSRAGVDLFKKGRGGCGDAQLKKLEREAMESGQNPTFDAARQRHDPGYDRLKIKTLNGIDNHGFALTGHHIVPIDLDQNRVCANNTKVFKGKPVNPCKVMKSMLFGGGISPYLDICNIVLLPTKSVAQKKAKNQGFDPKEWEDVFRNSYPNAVNHSSLNSYEYINGLWGVLSLNFESNIQQLQQPARKLEMCATLQGIGVMLLIAGPNDVTSTDINALNPFRNIRRF
jgi:hypothetical protein